MIAWLRQQRLRRIDVSRRKHQQKRFLSETNERRLFGRASPRRPVLLAPSYDSLQRTHDWRGGAGAAKQAQRMPGFMANVLVIGIDSRVRNATLLAWHRAREVSLGAGTLG